MDAAEIERLLADGTLKESVRVRGSTPDPTTDPIGWRRWWMTINPGKTWNDASAAWQREV